MARYLRERTKEREALLEAEVVIGELLANALRHSPGPICADFEWREERWPVVFVHDAGPCFEEPAVPGDRFAESGRGLHIVRALAENLRIQRVEPRGCVVAAVLRLTKRPDAHAGPTVCSRGEGRWELGCAHALEVHGLAATDATLKFSSRAG